MKSKEKLKECPSCLGTKEQYNPLDDEMQVCNFCKGKGKVTEGKLNLYDPISYELGLPFNIFEDE